MVEIGGRTLLDRVIEAVRITAARIKAVQIKAAQDASRDDANAGELASAHALSPLSPASVIVVGPERPTRYAVKWVREDPPGGGPVAAIAAGLAACSAEYVGVFAADLPFLNAATVHSLWTTLANSDDQDGAVAVDENGREQWLTAVYRRDALLAKIADQGADNLRGLPLRRLVEDLRLLRIMPTGQAVLDVDTWEDVAAVRRMIADPDDERD
jgi:molybdopterin-guanine dinucleotide biosynthesis protein A